MLRRALRRRRRATPARDIVSGAARVNLTIALRGTLAAAVPFLWLNAIGHPAEALFATIAVLNLCIADSGGPYRQRLIVMAVIAVVVPFVLVAGMQAQPIWWLAVGLMFVVAFLGGMARLFGGAGMAIGLIASLLFLIGIEVPGTWAQSLRYAGVYFAGAAWTILIVLVFWRFRPYRRIRLEVGECFRQLTDAVSVLKRVCAAAGAADERAFADAQMRVRDSVQLTKQTLGETFFQSESLPPFLADLGVLLRAAGRINAAVGSLAESAGVSGAKRLSPDGLRELAALLDRIEGDCQDIAAHLLEQGEGRRAEDRREELSGDNDGCLADIQTLLNVISRQLDAAMRVVDRLATHRRRRGLLPPLHGPSFPQGGWSLIRANFNPGSLVFRHALRVAAATSLGLAAYLLLGIPHGMWLPLTVLIVLQPHMGATMTRALHRTGGTILGAILAGVLVYLFQDTAFMPAAILGCFFLTLLFFRRRYWLAVMFLTPLIILLLTLLVHHPWVQIAERIGNTLGGAMLALAAAYWLWPSWEYRRLPDLIADAVAANRRYFTAIAEAAERGTEPGWPLAGIRAQAELATTNMRASLDRMLTEPKRFHTQVSRAIPLITHIERLTRHVSRLSIYLHNTPGTRIPFGDLAPVVTRKLEHLSEAIRNGTSPGDNDDLERAYAASRRAWQSRESELNTAWRTVDSLVASVVGDLNSLRAALAGE